MIKNYLTVAIRNLIRHKVHSLINISGLAVGIASCLIIASYVYSELSYDRYHENADRIYRVARDWCGPSGTVQTMITSPHEGLALRSDFPEAVKSVVRFRPPHNKVAVSYNERQFHEKRFFYSDPAVFQIFSFPLIKGNPEKALIEPNTIILTEKMAKKYFGHIDPMGEIISVDNDRTFTVTGIIQDIPQNSHFHPDFLASFSTLDATNSLGDWGSGSFVTYILLAEGYDPVVLEKQFTAMAQRHLSETERKFFKVNLHLQPLTDIHLHSHLLGEIEPQGDMRLIYILSGVSLFVLIIACINFINLSTARSIYREKEIGLRKVVGARRTQLIKQFLGESVLLTVVSLLVGIMLAELLLPWIFKFGDDEIGLNYFTNPELTLLGIVGMILFIGIISGSYPAVFLSSFQPSKALRGIHKKGSKHASVRGALVVFQFAISIILVVGTGIIYLQVDHMKTKELGFKGDQVVALPVNLNLSQKYEAIRNELLRNPNVINVGGSVGLPGAFISRNGVNLPETMKKDWTVSMIQTDHSFVKTLGMEIIDGRDFSKTFPADEKESFIINETAAKMFGWDKPVGKRVNWYSVDRSRYPDGKNGTVVGLVKDFHFRSLHEPIEPLILTLNPFYSHILVKIEPVNIPEMVKFIERTIEKFEPNHPFEFFFLDDSFDNLYRAEERAGEILLSFAVLAIIVASLGLFGMASLTAVQRTKEVGIRKVLGASVSNIVVLMSKDMVKWVLGACLIAWPIAYYAMNRWLENYPYRIDIGMGIFFLAGLIAIITAFLTISSQTIRVATANPVEALRYE